MSDPATRKRKTYKIGTVALAEALEEDQTMSTAKW